MRVDEQKLIEPPRGLSSGNPLSWCRFFGPGAIVASVTIGSGETIFPSRAGSMFGYQILWIILIVALLKWALAYSSFRHMILSGAHPLERWTCIPGPTGWLHMFIFVLAVVYYPLMYGFLAGVLGTIWVWIVGLDNPNAWATVWIGVAFVLLLTGSYRFLEKAQTVIVGLLVLYILFAVFHVQRDWGAVFHGMMSPKPLSYPDWALETMPHMRDKSVWLELLVFVSVIGGTGTNYLAYASFLRDKKWGRCHLGIANDEQLSEIAREKRHPARVWLRAAWVDSVISFGAVVIISSAFCILGVVILQPQQLVPDKYDLLNHQAQFLTAIAPWLKPLYMAGVFAAFFGTIYGSPELSHRFIYEILKTVPRWRGRLDERKVRWAVIVWCLGGGAIVLWWQHYHQHVQLIDVFAPGAICLGTLLCGIYALANPFMDRRFLPAALRMNPVFVGLNLVAGVALLASGIKALWEKDPVNWKIVLGLLLGSLLVAFVAQFYLKRSDT